MYPNFFWRQPVLNPHELFMSKLLEVRTNFRLSMLNVIYILSLYLSLLLLCFAHSLSFRVFVFFLSGRWFIRITNTKAMDMDRKTQKIILPDWNMNKTKRRKTHNYKCSSLVVYQIVWSMKWYCAFVCYFWRVQMCMWFNGGKRQFRWEKERERERGSKMKFENAYERKSVWLSLL